MNFRANTKIENPATTTNSPQLVAHRSFTLKYKTDDCLFVSYVLFLVVKYLSTKLFLHGYGGHVPRSHWKRSEIYLNLKNALSTISLFGMFEHLRKIPAKDKNILRFSEASNAWSSKITGYFSKGRRTSEQANRRYTWEGVFRRCQNCQKILQNREIGIT